jgi:hypothetical protein
MTRKEENVKRMTIDFSENEVKALLSLRSVKEFVTGKTVSLTEVLRDAITEKYVREKQAYRYVQFAEEEPNQEERDFVIDGIKRDRAAFNREEGV